MAESLEKEACDRVRFIRHKGKSVLLQDFSGMRPGPEFLECIDKARALISRQPQKSVLTVLDATDSAFDGDVISTLKSFADANTPFMKCTAVVGVSGLKQVALISVSRFTGRKLHAFDTRDEALDFLVEYNPEDS